MATILVIDDDEGIRRLVRRALAQAGHEVTEASDGRRGVQAARATWPDLVITDINMPDQEGIQTITELREMDADLPIVVISGEQDRDGYAPLSDARSLGADLAIAKPFPIAVLVAAVEHLLQGRMG